MSTKKAMDIEKTDSVVNLTKPPLYSIYNESSVTALNGEEEEDEGLYITKTHAPQAPPVPHQSLPVMALKFIAKVAFLAVFAFIYNEVSQKLRNDHIKLDKLTFQPLYVTEILLTNSLRTLKPLAYFTADPNLNYAAVLVVQGLIMGVFHPIMDFAMPPHLNKRLLSSNPNPGKSNIFNDVLRSLITFMGISYAIRHIEWSSQLQVSIVWSLLSPGLWLILDGTLGGLVASLALSTYGCLLIYVTNVDVFRQYGKMLAPHEFTPIWLWTASFFFCGVIIFGTLGRALF